MQHLARLAALIGRPYAVGADGPDCFDYYGLARHVLREVYGQDLPAIARPTAEPRAVARAILAHPERAAWEKVAEPFDGALVLMGNVDGRDFHLGVAVADGRQMLVLHTDEGPGVMADDLLTLPARGFHKITFFRRGPASESPDGSGSELFERCPSD
jgi:cell wall-associated NlpC family hydrolase